MLRIEVLPEIGQGAIELLHDGGELVRLIREVIGAKIVPRIREQHAILDQALYGGQGDGGCREWRQMGDLDRLELLLNQDDTIMASGHHHDMKEEQIEKDEDANEMGPHVQCLIV